MTATSQPDPMTPVLATFRKPEAIDFADAWDGLEPFLRPPVCRSGALWSLRRPAPDMRHQIAVSLDKAPGTLFF